MSMARDNCFRVSQNMPPSSDMQHTVHVIVYTFMLYGEVEWDSVDLEGVKELGRVERVKK